MAEPLPRELFNVLACPSCKGGLVYSEDLKSLCCKKCRASYGIKGGIPQMLPPTKA